MLRQIFRCIKPKSKDLWNQTGLTNGSNILKLNNSRFYQFNLNSTYVGKGSLPSNITGKENIYAYNVLQKVSMKKHIKTVDSDEISTKQFNDMLNQNWRKSSIGDIVDTFLKVKNYCVLNNINVSDTRFEKLVDGVIDNCEQISDKQLISLLYCLAEFPLEASYSAHNYHDLWSCLDDICCWKIVEWDNDTCFLVADAWYQMHLGKFCDYIYILLDRFVKKADKLTKEQLVNIYFYLNICRRRAVDFEYEFALEKLVNEMDVDEMAVVAMGYFKTKTKIKLTSILEAMADKVSENSKNIHQISLSAILKVLRYSQPIKIFSKIVNLSDKLSTEVDRLTYTCCTHLALMSTGIHSYNERIFQEISNKFIKEISNDSLIRIKDIERLLNALVMFNYDPKTTPNIYKAALDELHKRQDELNDYPRSLICTLNYLSLQNIYSYEFLNKVLDIEYIDKNFGKGTRSVPREIFSLNTCIDIECPDYSGNRLPPARKYKSVKWLLDWTPTHDQWKKLTKADQLVLSAIDAVKGIVKNEKLMYINHILPHFTRADIVLCRNKKTGEFIEPTGFENYVLGDVMFPVNNSSLEWFAIVILGWNNTIHNGSALLGHSLMKDRQLRKIGYKPVHVIWNEFTKLSEAQRKNYILNKLH